MSVPNPLQRNQQPSVTIGGVRYDWNPYVNNYVDASGKSIDGRQYYLLQPNQQQAVGQYTWDYTTGQYKDAQGNVMGQPGAPNPGAPTPAPAAPAAPDPYQQWLSSDPGSRPYRYFDETAKEFYDDNPTNAWGQYVDASFGTRDNPMTQYARGQYQRYYDSYLKASELAQGGTTYTDTLTGDLAGQIRRSFNLQSPNQKGYNLMWQPSGRTIFGG